MRSIFKRIVQSIVRPREGGHCRHLSVRGITDDDHERITYDLDLAKEKQLVQGLAYFCDVHKLSLHGSDIIRMSPVYCIPEKLSIKKKKKKKKQGVGGNLETDDESTPSTSSSRLYITTTKLRIPADSRGLALGTELYRVQQIFQRDSTIRIQNRTLRSILRSKCLAFTQLPRLEGLNLALSNLRTFKDLFGHVLVPTDYVIPVHPAFSALQWGRPLHNQVVYFRRRFRESRLSPEMLDELNALGFVWNVVDLFNDPEHATHYVTRKTRYQMQTRILPAIRLFYQQYGHVDIPHNFIIPGGDYSTSSSSSTHHQPLDEAQPFMWGTRRCIPLENDFVWPEALWHLKLGAAVSYVRKWPRLDDQVREELDALGFIWNTRHHYIRETIIPALEDYQSVHGHKVLPPPSYCIPKIDDQTKNWSLGYYIAQVQSRDQHSTPKTALPPDIRTRLKSLGVLFDKPTSRTRSRDDGLGITWSQLDLLAVLRVYRQIYGDMLIPTDFVIPENDPAWPARKNRKLGRQVVMLRQRRHSIPQVFEERLTQELGFVWNVRAYLETNPHVVHKCNKVRPTVLKALENYRKINGHVNVPIAFIIPEEDPHWPAELTSGWTKRLGKQVNQLRTRKKTLDPEFVQELDELGFRWRIPKTQITQIWVGA